MSRSSGDVPPLPVRLPGRQTPGSTPQVPARHNQSSVVVQRQSETNTRNISSSSSLLSSPSGLNLENLERRTDPARCRRQNDYRDVSTPRTTPVRTDVVTPTSESRQTSLSLPFDVGNPGSHRTSPSKKDGAGSGESDHRKKATKTSGSHTTAAASECRETIICQRCGRCRCAECARRKASSHRTIEVCSCVTCVRRVVATRHRHRHRSTPTDSDDDDDYYYDGTTATTHPCACGPCRPACCRRWALLVVLSVCLPCLCLYWPLRCVSGTCARCTGRSMRGCRCDAEPRESSQLSRRTLTSTTESVVVDRVTTT